MEGWFILVNAFAFGSVARHTAWQEHMLEQNSSPRGSKEARKRGRRRDQCPDVPYGRPPCPGKPSSGPLLLRLSSPPRPRKTRLATV